MPGPDDAFIYRLIDRAVTDRWTIVDLERAAAAAKIPLEVLKDRMADIIKNPAGRTSIAIAAQTLLKRIAVVEGAAAVAGTAAAAEGAAAVGTATAAGGEIGTAALAGGGAAGGGGAVGGGALGISLLGWVAIVVVGGLVLYGGYKLLTKEDSKVVRAPVATAPAKTQTQTQPISTTCTRSEPSLAAAGPAISVNTSTNSVIYKDSTGATNTIRWDDPPRSIPSGQNLTLTSSSTHNRDARIEVHWKHGNLIARGADSAVNVGGAERSTFNQFRGGKLELEGGIKGHLNPREPGYFLVAWNYTC